MLDTRALIWLRWRQFKDTAIYWLRVLGYQANERSLSQNLYVLYLLAIGAFWLYTVGGFALTSAVNIGKAMSGETVGTILFAVSWGIFLGQIWVLLNALRSTPLKLSFSDMAWVAASPIRRSAPVIVGFTRQVLIRIFVLGIATALLSALVSHALVGDNYGLVVARALTVLIPLVFLLWGVGWLVGMLRLIDPRIGRIRFLWILPVLLIPLAYIFPDPFLWIGRMAVLYVVGASEWWTVPLLVVLAVIASAIVVLLGDRINMIHAADESTLYARIQALGLMAWRNPDLQRRIMNQMRQAGRKPLLRLPRAEGVPTFIARAGLSYLRHPDMLLTTFGWGFIITSFALDTVIGNRPLQIWLLWIVIVALVPPTGLLHVFQSDRSEKFLRQFLPVDGLQLLIADIMLPFVVLLIGGGVAVVTAGLDPELTMLGLVILPIGAVLVTLAGAVALTTTRVLQTRLLATGASFGAAVIAAAALTTPLAGLAVGFLAALVMAGIVAQDA
ncbi:MAG: hypothetical protein IAE80_06295 [Anaerolinea sp.]|nr:hypothetical protein [Anaerolinea sp.]